MSDVTTWYAVAALAVTTAGGILTNYLGRTRRQEIEVAEDQSADLAGADLTTLAGIATVVSRQSLKISALEAKASAMGRYQRVLVAALRGAGVPVPAPDPEDEPLIRG